MLNFKPTTIESKKDLKTASLKLGGKTIDAIGASLDVVTSTAILINKLVDSFDRLLFGTDQSQIQELFEEMVEAIKAFEEKDSADNKHLKAMRISIFIESAVEVKSDFKESDTYKIAQSLLNDCGIVAIKKKEEA